MNFDRRALFDQLSQFALNSCSPIVIGRHPDVVGNECAEVRNGSGTLIRVHSRDYLVTVKHVVDAYRRRVSDDPRTVFLFSDIEFDPLPRITGESDTTDLVTISMEGLAPGRNAHHLPTLRPHQPIYWPPKRPQPGDAVILTGWPEEERKVLDGGREIFHKPEALVGIKVTDASDSKFQLALDRTHWSQSGNRGDSYLTAPIGSGFSGAPIFREASFGGVTTFDLVGLVQAYGGSFDILIASYASDIPGVIIS